ncbi:MAG: GNAT family N-acetyltransferase [Oleiphilaceae bacterium]|nr:GNAT family N-acetyltransferase [Oleiphilaceae bacterium]
MFIKDAGIEDIQLWASMRTKLWPTSVGQHIGELQEYFDGNSIDIEQAYLLFSKEKQAIGFIELNIREFAEGSRHPRVPYVEAWFVEQAFQSAGGGTMLMTKAEMWAKGKGFNELASDTEISNTKSILIHNKLGFIETERVVCFLKKLT